MAKRLTQIEKAIQQIDLEIAALQSARAALLKQLLRIPAKQPTAHPDPITTIEG